MSTAKTLQELFWFVTVIKSGKKPGARVYEYLDPHPAPAEFESGYMPPEMIGIDRGTPTYGIELWDDNVCLEQCLYKDWRQFGIQRKWYPDGRLQSESPYKNGLEDGTFREWDEQGHMIAQYEMKGGSGTRRIYYPNGHLHMESTQVAGQRVGIEVTCYPDGHIESLQNDKSGRSGGVFQFAPDGRLAVIATHAGVEARFTADGTPTAIFSSPAREVLSPEAYAELAAKDPQLTPYYADCNRYRELYTPELQAIVARYNALPPVQIPLALDVADFRHQK